LLSATHRKKGPLVYCVTYGGLSPTDVFWLMLYNVYMPLLHGWLMAEKEKLCADAKGKWI
jgi:hypothetical protein